MARIIDIRGPVFALAILLCAGRAWGEIHALLVGGGPDRQNNTAQIEEHLRFVVSLVPASQGRVVLFADGKPNSRNLTYSDSIHLSPGQRALDILLPNDSLGAKELMRAPVIGAGLDGPSRLTSIDRGFSRLASLSQQNGPPILLYFAGHGNVSHNKNKDSVYNLWNDENLDPETLVREIDSLPARVPVTLVMAQCFSGGFGNVIFKNANPDQPLNPHPIAGFFAAESDREAAGCGTDTNSPLYQDFSSYFFGALSGRDKLGHVVTGADYDGDGRVSCHEAYCYAMIHDQSIDTPVCTSLVFLRKYADMPDASIYITPWKTVMEGADAAQKAALEALSQKLGLDGEQRVLDAYDRLMFRDPVGQSEQLRNYRDAQDRLNDVRMQSLRSLFVKWPALRWRDSNDYDKATRGAAVDLNKDTAQCQQIIGTSDAFDRADTVLDVEESMLVRFTDLAEASVRGQYLHHHADAPTKAQFESLCRAENQPLAVAPPAR